VKIEEFEDKSKQLTGVLKRDIQSCFQIPITIQRSGKRVRARTADEMEKPKRVIK